MTQLMDIHRVKRDRLRGQPQVLRELLASCQVDQGNAPDWVEAALADGVPSVATMVYHSVVWQYLWTVGRARFERVMAVAGEAATHNKPLAMASLRASRQRRRRPLATLACE